MKGTTLVKCSLEDTAEQLVLCYLFLGVDRLTVLSLGYTLAENLRIAMASATPASGWGATNSQLFSLFSASCAGVRLAR